MARMNWFDEDTKHPVIDEQVEKLESFADAMADGIIESQELERQERSPGRRDAGSGRFAERRAARRK